MGVCACTQSGLDVKPKWEGHNFSFCCFLLLHSATTPPPSPPSSTGVQLALMLWSLTLSTDKPRQKVSSFFFVCFIHFFLLYYYLFSSFFVFCFCFCFCFLFFNLQNDNHVLPTVFVCLFVSSIGSMTIVIFFFLVSLLFLCYRFDGVLVGKKKREKKNKNNKTNKLDTGTAFFFLCVCVCVCTCVLSLFSDATFSLCVYVCSCYCHFVCLLLRSHAFFLVFFFPPSFTCSLQTRGSTKDARE